MRRHLVYIPRKHTSPREWEVHELGLVLGVIIETNSGWRICGPSPVPYRTKEQAGQKLAAQQRRAVHRV